MAVTGSKNVKNPNENKKRRASKKSKLSWRKHCDVKDVDSFLEDQALEERLGGPVAEKPSEELFCLDKEPTVADHLINLFSSKSAKRAALKKKPVKSYAVLKPHSAVRDASGKRNRVRTVEERHPTATKIVAYRKEHGIINKKEQLAIKNRKYTLQQKETAKLEKGSPVQTDLWAEPGNVSNPYGVDGEWMYKTTLVHNLKNTRSMKWTVPKSIHTKLSLTSVVEIPHPGTSYNPSFLDHQALLHEVVESEKKIIKEEKHLSRVTSRMFSRVSNKSNEKTWLQEMSEGLPQNEVHKEIGSDTEDDGDYKAINPPVRNVKKPLQKRRKIKEAKAEKEVKKEAKVERKKMSDIHRMSVVNKELKVQADKRDMLHKKREKVNAIKKLEPHQLSHTKFQAPDHDFNTSKELTGSLRTITTAGSLLSDRYKSLQKRNIIAPTKGMQLPRKGKVKKFEKSTYKMGWEPQGF